MLYFTKRLDNTQRHPMFRRCLFCGLTATAFMMAAERAHAALIVPVSSSDVPVFNTASVFDASHAGNSYSVEPGTTLSPGGFDIRDLFGGSFGTYGYEQHDVIFNNGQPAGTVSAVDVTLAAPVSLTNFNLFLEDDGTSGNRSATEFKLFADGQLVDDVPILNTFGNESYTSAFGSNYIDISDTLAGLPLMAAITRLGLQVDIEEVFDLFIRGPRFGEKFRLQAVFLVRNNHRDDEGAGRSSAATESIRSLSRTVE